MWTKIDWGNENKADYYIVTTYGSILPANCDIHYMERNVDGRLFTGTSVCYKGDNLKFNEPLLFTDEGIPYDLNDYEFENCNLIL